MRQAWQKLVDTFWMPPPGKITWQRPRPKWRVVDCNGENPSDGDVNPPKVEFYTWEEAIIYVNDHALHIIEEK